MGAQQAAQVLVTVKQQQRARDSAPLSDDERRRLTEATVRQFEQEGTPYFSSARLWDDGIIDPADTRQTLALGLSAAANAPVPATSYGVFRM